jgi:hypothetical protein
MKELYEKVPASFLRKRFMGQAPSSEIYLEKRMKFYTAKSARWSAEGRLEKDAPWYESTRISIALELSLYWNQYAHYSKKSLDTLTAKLEGYLAQDGLASKDLDTPEETALCHCILGACYLSITDFTKAREHLSEAETLAGGLGEAYNYLAALSRLYQAILECKEGDLEEEAKDSESRKKDLWRDKLGKAEKKLDEMFLLPAYDMNGRVESRGDPSSYCSSSCGILMYVSQAKCSESKLARRSRNSGLLEAELYRSNTDARYPYAIPIRSAVSVQTNASPHMQVARRVQTIHCPVIVHSTHHI